MWLEIYGLCPQGDASRGQRQCCSWQASQALVTQDLCICLLTLPPTNSVEPPSWVGGGAFCAPEPPLPPLALLTTRGMESSVCSPGSPVRLGLIDWLLHFSARHKDSHIQALSLYLLNAFIHVVTHLQIFIACSMPDTVLGVEYLSKWAKVGRIVAVPSGCCPFVFLLKFILNLFHLVN